MFTTAKSTSYGPDGAEGNMENEGVIPRMTSRKARAILKTMSALPHRI